MTWHRLVLYLFGILACLNVRIAAHEAIVGGSMAPDDEFRYQVSILISGYPFNCGGGILNTLFVISAAHCVIHYANGHLIGLPIAVYAKMYFLGSTDVNRNVDRIYVPWDYEYSITDSVGDIAILRLSEPLVIHGHDLKELSLPRSTQQTFNRRMGRIAGYGHIEHNDVETDHRLRFAEAWGRTTQECQMDHPHLRITNKHLCARVVQQPLSHFASHGTCPGDGGGPLVIDGNVCAGILSISPPGCSEKNSSGVYTRVSHYRQFILNAINNYTREMRVFKLHR